MIKRQTVCLSQPLDAWNPSWGWKSSAFWSSLSSRQYKIGVFNSLLVWNFADNHDIYGTVPAESDLDKLLSQCLSQHAITFVLKPSLSISLSVSPLIPACLLSPFLPHFLPLSPPSVVHSVPPLLFSASLFRLVSRFFLPKLWLCNSVGVSDIQIPKPCLFSFSNTFSHPQVLHLSVLASCLTRRAPVLWLRGIMRVPFDYFSCRFKTWKKLNIINLKKKKW